jgi:hypothetical protein
LGFGKVLAEIDGELAQAYYARMRVFLEKYIIVDFGPAAHQRILAAGTRRAGPAALATGLKVHPRDASGFTPVDGVLLSDALADADQLEEQSDASERHILSRFDEQIPLSWINQVKWKRGRGSRRR